MATQNAPRLRLALAGVSLATASALAIGWALTATRSGGALAVLGGVGVALLAAALAGGRDRLVAWSLAALLAEYVVWLSAGARAVELSAALVAAALFLVGESAHEAVRLIRVERVEWALAVALCARLATSALAATAVALAVLAIAGANISGGAGTAAGGMVAAALILALLAGLRARRLGAGRG